jgi:hypothetical protein
MGALYWALYATRTPHADFSQLHTTILIACKPNSKIRSRVQPNTPSPQPYHARDRMPRPVCPPTPSPCPTTPRFTCFCQKHLVTLPALPGRYDGTTLVSCVFRPILPWYPCAGATGNGRLAPLHEVHGPLFHREPLTICTFRGAGAPYFWNKSPHVLLQPSIVRIDGAPR